MRKNLTAWLCAGVGACLLAGSVIGIQALAQDIAAQSQQSSSKQANRLFMWKVQGAKGTVYLLGTIHVGKDNFYPLPPEIEKAFNSSEALVGEVDQTRENGAEIQQMIAAAGIYPEGDTLSNHITKKTATALHGYLSHSTMPAATLSRMKPWLASITVMMDEVQRDGFDPKNGIDKHFMDEAQEMKKPIGQLENADFQVRLISGFPEDLQDKLLYSSLLEAKSTKESIETMARAWQTGDAQELERIISKDEREHPELKPLYEKICYDRNQAMVRKIQGWLDKPHKYFVVVGAAHLLGPRGILKLLENAGNKVEQVTRS